MSRESNDQYYEDDNVILSKGILLFNLMLLNVMWFLCSLPVVTMGAATTAMNYTCIKMRKDEGDSIVRMFFHSFAVNIRQAVVLHTGLLAVLIVVVAGLIQSAGSANAGSTMGVVLSIVCVLMIFLWIVAYTWIFMILARFDNSIGRTLTNSAYLAVTKPLITMKALAAALFITIVVPLALWLYFPYGFPLVLFFTAPTCSYVIVRIFEPLFDELIEAQKKKNR